MSAININLNLGGPGGISFGNTHSMAEHKEFKDQLKGQSPEDLGKMLGQKGLEPWKQQEVLKELLQRLEDMLKQDAKASSGDQMSPNDKNDLEDLLKSLMGKDSQRNNASGDMAGKLVGKLLEALGVPKQVASALGEALTQAGDQGGGSQGMDNGDIH